MSNTSQQLPQSNTDPNRAEDKRKYLEFIQNIITRMNGNSFMIKGWAVTIVAALLALFASTKNPAFLYVNLLPVLLFWVLDANYLQMERKFRTLYKEAIKNQPAISIYEMNIEHSGLPKEKENRYLNVLKSDTIYPFYLFLLVVSALCILFIQTGKEPSKPIAVSVSDTIRVKIIDTVNNKRHVESRVLLPDTSKHN